jgi:hypothetical protein
MTPGTDIHAKAFFLADHAVVESGKIYTSGAFWNQLRFPSFPAVYTFAVVSVLHIPWRAYHQRHKFSVHFMDADAKPMPGRLEGEFQVGAAPEMLVGEPTIMPFAAVVGNFVFIRPGDYAAVLEVDGAELDRWILGVKQQMSAVAPSGIGSADLPLGPLPD